MAMPRLERRLGGGSRFGENSVLNVFLLERGAKMQRVRVGVDL